MQRRDKVRVQELIDKWTERADKAENGSGPVYSHCAQELRKLLAGQPTEADGFRPQKKV